MSPDGLNLLDAYKGALFKMTSALQGGGYKAYVGERAGRL